MYVCFTCLQLQVLTHYKKQTSTGILYRLGLSISKFYLSEKERLSKRTQELQWAVPNRAFFSYLKVRTYLVARRTPPGA